MRSPTLRSLLALATAVLLIAGCAPQPTSPGTPAAPKAEIGKVVIVGQDSDIPTADPHMHNERTGIILGYNLYDALVDRDTATWKPIPRLAESWKIVNDTTWEFKLRKGVKFHNGEALDANAVKWNIDRVLNPDQKSPQRGNISFIKEVKVVDETTVQFITHAPYPPLLERMVTLYFIPPKYTQEVGDEKFATNPVGSGPFKFKSWTKGEKVELERNPDYFGGAPNIAGIIFRNIPEKATQIAELTAGGIHVMRTIPPDNTEQVTKAGHKVEGAEILRTWYLSLDTTKPPLDNAALRQAIAHGINIDAQIKGIWNGKAVRVHALVNPKQFGHDANIKAREFDPEKAKKLVEQANATGLQLTLDFYSPGAGIQVADAIAADLNKIGLKVTPKKWDVGALVQQTRAGKIPLSKGNWGSYSVFDADAILEPLLHKDGPYGVWHQVDPKQNDWITAARSTLNEAERKRLYTQLQQFIVDNVTHVSLYAPVDLWGINKDLDTKARADEIIFLHKAKWLK